MHASRGFPRSILYCFNVNVNKFIDWLTDRLNTGWRRDGSSMLWWRWRRWWRHLAAAVFYASRITADAFVWPQFKENLVMNNWLYLTKILTHTMKIHDYVNISLRYVNDCLFSLTSQFIVSYRSRRCTLSPLYPLLSNCWITVLYELFVTVTTVSSSGDITFIVIINIQTTPTFVCISFKTVNWTWVNNIWWQTVPQVNISLSKKYFCILYLQ